MATQVQLHPSLDMRTRRLLWSMRTMNKQAMQRIADVVAAEAKQRAPVRTGTLRDSIKGKVRKIYRGDGITATISANTKGKWKQVTKRNGQPVLARDGRPLRRKEKFGYSKLVELGPYGGGRAYASTPFLRPALLAKIEEIKVIFQEESARAAREHNR